MTWLKRASSDDPKKQHRVCSECDQIIRRHHRWKQIKVKRFGIFGSVFKIRHRDCKDPTLEKARAKAAPPPVPTPIDEWLRENDLPLSTWTGSKNASTETI